MESCDKCNETSMDIKKYVISNSAGIKKINLCSRCANELLQASSATLEDLNTLNCANSTQQPTKTHSNISMLYKIIAIIIAIAGFASGIFSGIASEEFIISVYIWLGSALSFSIFWAIYCILKNQEQILSLIKNSENNQ